MRIDFQFGVLERGLDFLRQFAFDALLHGDLLARAGKVGIDVAKLQATHVDFSRNQACTQDVGHLLQLEITGRGLGDDVVLAQEFGIHAFEVKARGQLAAGLIHRIGELVGIYFRNDVEGRHGIGQG